MGLKQELSLVTVSVARLYISLQRRGRNLQMSNALWELVVKFLVKKWSF